MKFIKLCLACWKIICLIWIYFSCMYVIVTENLSPFLILFVTTILGLLLYILITELVESEDYTEENEIPNYTEENEIPNYTEEIHEIIRTRKNRTPKKR